MKIRKLLLGFILIVGLFQSESMAQINYYINSQGIPINASAVEAKQRLANGENYLGEIRSYPSTTNPSSWIRADGRLLNINQYLPLYGMLQNRYGGDGINTFAVPKLVPIDSDDSTNNVNWSIVGDKLKAIGLLGSLNNYNVQFIRNNVNQFSLTSTGIVSNVDYTTSGNVTLQKGNPRIRMRDIGAGGHTNGFDLHVNGDEFIIDDNTHSKNILRNYLNSTVHTTDFDAEVYNFKNGGSSYVALNSSGIDLSPGRLFMQGGVFSMARVGNYNVLADGIGRNAIYLGGGIDPSNYYDNIHHVFRNVNGSATYATLNSTGLGIGTTSPSAKLEVVGSGATSIRIFNTLANTWDITNTAPSGELAFTRGGVNTHLTINNVGDVGIGTTTPNSKFEVTGNIGLSPNIGSSRYLFIPSATDTYNGVLHLQSGAGSSGFGGSITSFGHSHATRPGSIIAGISVGSGTVGAANEGRFAVTSGALAEGTELFTVLRTGSVGISTTTINASAKLEVTSTTQGVLLPRMTTTQINAISSPANGLMVYNTTLNKLCVYENTSWRQVSTTAM